MLHWHGVKRSPSRAITSCSSRSSWVICGTRCARFPPMRRLKRVDLPGDTVATVAFDDELAWRFSSSPSSSCNESGNAVLANGVRSHPASDLEEKKGETEERCQGHDPPDLQDGQMNRGQLWLLAMQQR